MDEEFKKDPDVQPLIEKIVEAREELDRNRAMARRRDDPSVMAVQRQLDKPDERSGTRSGRRRRTRSPTG